MADFIGNSGSDTWTGTPGEDWATGEGGNDTLKGDAGNDVLAGGAGADLLEGGDGDDYLFSASGLAAVSQIIDPANYFDRGTEVDTLNGGNGADRILAGYGDFADGGADIPDVPAEWGGDRLYLSLQGAKAGVTADFTKSTLTIGGGTIKNIEIFEFIEGSKHNDTLTVGANARTVFGADGDDVIKMAAYGQATQIYGGGGNDKIDIRGGSAALVDGGDGNDLIYVSNESTQVFGGVGNDTIYAYARVQGGAGDDVIYLSSMDNGADFASGGDGADTITASKFGNILVGGAGADILNGGAGRDRIFSAGGDDYWASAGSAPPDDMGLERDTLTGGAGDDDLAGGSGDSIDGGSGYDRLYLSLGGMTSGVVLNTAGIVSGQAFSLGGGTIRNVDELAYLRGTEFNDTLTLAVQSQRLDVSTGAGDDVITTSTSEVHVDGGAGDDRFYSMGVAPQPGNRQSSFNGGDGVDTADYSRATKGVAVALSSDAGADILTSVENVIGSRFNDTLTGDAGANVIDGGAGADTMAGGAGDDTYYVDSAKDTVSEGSTKGGYDTVISSVTFALTRNIEKLTLAGTANVDAKGNELANVITGNSGQNRITGGAGADTLTGGAKTDTFIYTAVTDSTVAASDLITDLKDTTDWIDLSRIDGNTSKSGVQGFKIVDAFTQHAGELVLDYNATTKITSLMLDVNGDGKADMLIRLTGDHEHFDRFIFGGG